MQDAAGYRFILLEREGIAWRLTFNRPERHNALTQAMMAEIGDAVDRVAADAQARALVLRGAGGAFSAGGDLGAMSELPPQPARGADPLVAQYRMFGDVLAKAGESRDGGSFFDRMGAVACWNAVMDENQYMVRKWNEFVAA